MKFALRDAQVRELQEFLHSTRDKNEHTRALALLMRHRGSTVAEVAHTLHICIDVVFRWCRSYREEGIDGLKAAEPHGRTPVVKAKAMKIMPKLLKEDPQAFGFLKGRWVCRDIARALNEEGVNIGFRYVADILHELGLEYKRPKLTVKSNDSQYYRKRKEIRNYKKASAALAKKG